MSELAAKISPQVLRTPEPHNAAELAVQTDVNSETKQNRIPLTVRSRLRVTRVSPPIDDGFRPFRVF